MKFGVHKTLKLYVEVEAEDEDDAVEQVTELNDLHFQVIDCDYCPIPLEGE